MAQKQPNQWGLYDMLGNVWEWCSDRVYRKYSGTAMQDPNGPATGEKWVIRGGAWTSSEERVRAATRLPREPGFRLHNLGLRLTRGRILPHEYIEPTTEMRFLMVPGGRFRMGADGAGSASPSRWVRLLPYLLGEVPVTVLQYERFLAANPQASQPKYWGRAAEEPVIGVRWTDAMAFCEWFSSLPSVTRARLRASLPSEAQWEFAARGFDGRSFPWGEAEPDKRVVVFGGEVSGAFPVPAGSLPAGIGPFGHYDLVGNGPEWCLDRWNKDAYKLREDDTLDPVTESGTSNWRVVRGYVRERRRGGAAAREGFEPSHRIAGGFRVLLAPRM